MHICALDVADGTVWPVVEMMSLDRRALLGEGDEGDVYVDMTGSTQEQQRQQSVQLLKVTERVMLLLLCSTLTGSCVVCCANRKARIICRARCGM